MLSAGHFLVGDTSTGEAEVDFGSGLSSEATWTGSGCTGAYCHSNGNGAFVDVQVGDDVACGTCHAVESSWWTGGWLFLGGEHIKHLWEGYLCADCHADTVGSGDSIVDPTKHVNGSLDVALPSGISWSAGTCTGDCHGEQHNSRGW